MRNVLVRLHLYAALLCASYLVLLGVSALNYNHHFGRATADKVRWVRLPCVTDTHDDARLSEAVLDTLGLAGWIVPGQTRRDEAGDLHFGISRPGKHYTVNVLFSANRITVDETREGLWPVLDGLHGLTQLPGSRVIKLWGIYTNVCMGVVVFAAVTGLGLWLTERRDRIVGAWVLGSASGVSLLLMAYVWWRG